MDWANERYVALYTRDTVTWMLLDWDARSVLKEMLRKCDRAGVIEVGDDGLMGLAALLRAPLDVVERAMPQLLRRDTVVMRDGFVVIPNFLAAQETPRTDRQRQRDSREKRRDVALAVARGLLPRDPHVTNRDETVTDGHVGSQPVTPIRAKTSKRGGEATPSPPPPPAGDIVERLWDYQAELRARIPGTRPVRLTDAGRRRLQALLADGYTEGDLRACLDAYAAEARDKGGRWFDGVGNWKPENIDRTLGRLVVGAAPAAGAAAAERAARLRRESDERAQRARDDVTRRARAAGFGDSDCDDDPNPEGAEP